MKPAPFEYYAPTSLAEAVSLLSDHEGACLMAGGQSLMAMLNMRFVQPDQIIDLNRIAELDFVRVENSDLVIGAMTRQRTLERLQTVATVLPIMPKALRFVGHMQTRNRGTLGGSLCQLDPSAELPAIAAAYDAVVEATGPNGPRRIPFAEFPVSYMTTSLQPGEVLTAVRFPRWDGRMGYGFREFSRRHGDFAVAGAIALLQAGSDGVITRASLTAFGISQAPVRTTQAEALLVGQKPSTELFEKASAFCRDLATLDDPYSSAAYRGHVVATMAERALADAAADLNLN